MNSPVPPAAELRQLVEDLLEISAEGRRMANDLSRSIKDIVAIQCDSIEDRARTILARAEQLQNSR